MHIYEHDIDIVHIPKFVIGTVFSILTFIATCVGMYWILHGESQYFRIIGIFVLGLNGAGCISFLLMMRQGLKYKRTRRKKTEREMLREKLLNDH